VFRQDDVILGMIRDPTLGTIRELLGVGH
jgi:hypothetical protein